MKALELREKTLIIEAAAPRMLSQEEELHLQVIATLFLLTITQTSKFL